MCSYKLGFGGDNVSDIEKSIANELAKLPTDVQDKFLMMAQGAAMAVEYARAAEEKKEGEESDGADD